MNTTSLTTPEVVCALRRKRRVRKKAKAPMPRGTSPMPRSQSPLCKEVDTGVLLRIESIHLLLRSLHSPQRRYTVKNREARRGRSFSVEVPQNPCSPLGLDPCQEAEGRGKHS